MTYLSVNFRLWSFKEFYTIQNLIYCHQRNFNIFQKVAKTTKKRDVIGEWATKKDRERDKPFKNIRKQKHTKKHILSHLPFKFVFCFVFCIPSKFFVSIDQNPFFQWMNNYNKMNFLVFKNYPKQIKKINILRCSHLWINIWI